MTNRSAMSSIKGYNFQFLHTIDEFLKRESNEIFTIEGIEDLDIKDDIEKSLLQYKYHEEQTYTNSKVGKPIGIMFNHFINNKTVGLKYKLFIYLNDDLPELNTTRLQDILKNTAATDHIKNKVKIDDELIDEFIKVFSWSKVQDYEQVENEIVVKLSAFFKIDENTSKYFYLPNAFKVIHETAMQKDITNRTMSKQDFINLLNQRKNLLHSNYLIRTQGFSKFKNEIFSVFKRSNISKNTRNFIYYISNHKRFQIEDLIINITKNHCYPNNKRDFKAAVFIVDINSEELRSLKESIFENLSVNREILLMNDGYEDYSFNIDIFNLDNIITTTKSRSHIKSTSFNFKILSYNTYQKNSININFSSSVYFFLDDDVLLDKFHIHNKAFSFKGLNNEQILDIVGGYNG